MVGVEISSDLAAIAKKRIEQETWNNVHVAVGSAQTISLPGKFDGILLFAAHEVLTSPEALDHLLAHLRKGGRIVAFGAKLSYSRRGRLLNPLLRLLTHTLLPASSAPVDARPWRFLEDRAGKLHMEERTAGLLYLVSGCLASKRHLAGTRIAAGPMHSVFNRTNNDNGIAAALLNGELYRVGTLIAIVLIAVLALVAGCRRLSRAYRLELDTKPGGTARSRSNSSTQQSGSVMTS